MQQITRPYEGLFITIEGGDGCGKTTICDRLAKELEKRGYEIIKTREPGGTKLSEHIRSLVLNPKKEFSISEKTELLLFLAARAQHLEEKILPALRQGKVVICERFNDSTIAYQGVARHLGMQFVEKLCQLLFEDPDFTLFLDIEPAAGMERIQTKRKEKLDRLDQEKLQFHKEVRQGFLHLADEHPDRITIIDATLPIDQVVSTAMTAIEPHLTLKPKTRVV